MIGYTYILINIGTILIPFIFSFHPKLNFYKRWNAVLLSITLVGGAFITWDIIFTEIGVWGFNQDYLVGLNILGLPIEEWLFFITIPYACMFTFHCFQKLIPPKIWINPNLVSGAWALILITIGFIFLDKLYTSVTFFALGVVLIYMQFIIKATWLPRLYFTFLVLIFPFLIINGILTGTGLDTEVVWYNTQEIIGVRILTIPVEDFCYGSLLLILNVYMLELLTARKNSKIERIY